MNKIYTEFIKIIEGGLNNDFQKVLSYTNLLIQNLKEDGNLKLANRLEALLKNQKVNMVFQDELFIAPVDQDSRMAMADILFPSQIQIPELVFPNYLNDGINAFIDTFNHRQDIEEAGIEVASSLLLYGPPGCGKTSIAKYIAKSLGLPLVTARFDSLISSLLGNTSKNIRKVFEYASNKPCVLFLDEFDAIAKARDDQHELGELKRVINSLLQNIDQFAQSNILIAATNHEELLDRAIWRRFNHIISIQLPQKQELHDLLRIYLKSVQTDFLDNQKKSEAIITLLGNISPADLMSICNKAKTNFIIKKDSYLSFEEFVKQVFVYKSSNHFSTDELIRFMYEAGSTHATIAEYFKISTRQVANSLNKLKDGK
jgi:Cdc6-like AAA superfamily ATPase